MKEKYTKCKVDECDGRGFIGKSGIETFTKGYCLFHYERSLNGTDINAIKREFGIYVKCRIENCLGSGRKHKNREKEVFERGYCTKHYHKLMKYGNPLFIKIRNNKNRKDNYLYVTYKGIKTRCYNPNEIGYKNYGGRGIKVCERWLGDNGFNNFVLDMGEKPTKKHSIDRINVNGNYEPSNCRWATRHEQNANTRRNNKVVGVRYDKFRNKYLASLSVNKITVISKRFETFDEAVSARIAAEKIYNIYK